MTTWLLDTSSSAGDLGGRDQARWPVTDTPGKVSLEQKGGRRGEEREGKADLGEVGEWSRGRGPRRRGSPYPLAHADELVRRGSPL